jgi:hypothetical protein
LAAFDGKTIKWEKEEITMIYVEDNFILHPGKYPAFLALEHGMADFLKGTDVKHVASWHTTVGNQQELTFLYSCDDMGKWDKAVFGLSQNKEFVAVYQKALELAVSTSRKVMMPTPGSPLK